MKLQQIYLKIEKGMIPNTDKFSVEMRILLSNQLQNNLTNAKVYPLVMNTLSSFEALITQVNNNLPFYDKASLVRKPAPKKQSPKPELPKPPAVIKQKSEEPQTLSAEEVKKLATDIRQLTKPQLMGILQIMKDSSAAN